MTWDTRWIDMTYFIAQWSKDKDTKTGAVIVDNRNVLISLGWNGFPRGINDDVKERYKRPIKYKWTEHAERNAIYNAAAKGHSLLGCKIYTSWYPCADCARAIIQSGISELICVEPDWDDERNERWKDHFKVVKEMLGETEVKVRWIIKEG